jgi:hypothetical protein
VALIFGGYTLGALLIGIAMFRRSDTAK